MTRPKRKVSAAVCAATFVAAAFAGSADAQVSQSGEQKNMRRVGHTDLQGRPAYQPNMIVYPDGRTIAFVGTHGGSKPNPLKGGAVELNAGLVSRRGGALPSAGTAQISLWRRFSFSTMNVRT